MLSPIFPATAARVAEWQAQPEVLGVLLVGSKSHEYADALSDDDLEVVLTPEAHAQIAPSACSDALVEGSGAERRMIYDAEYTSLEDLQSKRHSPLDINHWPYERAQVLFDPDGRVGEAVAAAARMDLEFRRLRLLHGTIDAWIAPYRARKTVERGYTAAGHLLVARGAKALSRIVFALEGRWVPMDHWLEPELHTLADPARAGAAISDALQSGSYEPLATALDALAAQLAAEGVPPRAGWRDLFIELIHPARAEERAIHGL